jgi:adenosine kinase
VRIALTGSIATDHLMSFGGRFADSFVPGQLDHVSLSFLVDDLQIRRGGVAANIAFGMAALGGSPALVGAVGQDFADYRSWLERHGIDCRSVLVSEVDSTARFVCTTDSELAQIASFYPGAMRRAREIELGPVLDRLGGLDLVVVSPNDPEAMIRHTAECRARGLPFAADPSQQLAFLDGEATRALVDGAAYLFTNDYEAALIQSRTGWSEQDISERVTTRVVTHGKDGATVTVAERPPVHVDVVAPASVADPTGVGDAFRAGFLTALGWGLDGGQCAQLGSVLAAYVLETVGTQEYTLDRVGVLHRLRDTYGEQSSALVGEHLRIG